MTPTEMKLDLILSNQTRIMRALIALTTPRYDGHEDLRRQVEATVQALMMHETFVTEYGINTPDAQLIRVPYKEWPNWMERFKP